MAGMRHVIVGASAAGIAAAEAIRSVDPEASITVIAEEPHEPYARIFVPHRLREAIPLTRLTMRPAGLWSRLRVTPLLGRAAAGLDAAGHVVHLSDGSSVPYDRLLIATGASPVALPSECAGLDGVSGLRTWADAERLAGWLADARHVLVVGAGLVSLKALEQLVRLPVTLTVVATSHQVLTQLLDPRPADAVQARLEAQGVRVITGADVRRLEGQGRVEQAVLTTGEVIPCQVVIVGKGVTPNVVWLAGSGVQVAQGVPVDEHCGTNVPGVYAAGDVAEAHDRTRGGARINAMWPNAIAQGRIAGLNMAGHGATYDGSLSLNIGSFAGLPVAAVGISRPRGGPYEERLLCDDGERYRKVVLHEGTIVGAMLTGDLQPAGALVSLVSRRARHAEWEALLGRRRFTLPAQLGTFGVPRG